jgi:hypothetical protein
MDRKWLASSVDQLEIPRLRGAGKPRQHPILVIPIWGFGGSLKGWKHEKECVFEMDKNTFCAPRCWFSNRSKQEVLPSYHLRTKERSSNQWDKYVYEDTVETKEENPIYGLGRQIHPETTRAKQAEKEFRETKR